MPLSWLLLDRTLRAQGFKGQIYQILWHQLNAPILNIIVGDTCVESTCRCGSCLSILLWSEPVYPFPVKTKRTMHSTASETGDIKNGTQQLRRKKREGKKCIYQTPIVLNTIENFSSVRAADNSPRLWKNKPFVIMHFQVIFPISRYKQRAIQQFPQLTHFRTMSFAISEIWLHSSSGNSKLPVMIFFRMSFGIVRLWCLE